MPYSTKAIPAQVVGRLKYNLKQFITHAHAAGAEQADLEGLRRLANLLLQQAQLPIDWDDQGNRISPPLGTIKACEATGDHEWEHGFCRVCGTHQHP